MIPRWKKVRGADSQSSYLSENTGEEGVKSGKNKEKLNDPRVFIVLQTQLAFFPGSLRSETSHS